eukprot:28249-Eustigmatos_ZCMA.PRE.1
MWDPWLPQVFVHLQRDWTVDGGEIRHKTYGPLLKEVAQHVREQGGQPPFAPLIRPHQTLVTGFH